MGISDIIAGFINEVLGEMGGTAELQRIELANKFNCVPSQINYVIATRFSPEHGYIVESRRGGGGFIRITRVAMEPEMLTMHTVNAIGDMIDVNTTAALIANLHKGGAISDTEARLMLSAISNNALRPVQPEGRNLLRASILKQMLINKNYAEIHAGGVDDDMRQRRELYMQMRTAADNEDFEKAAEIRDKIKEMEQ